MIFSAALARPRLHA